MNPVRVDFIRSVLAEKLLKTNFSPLDQIRGLTVLDIGCGGKRKDIYYILN